MITFNLLKTVFELLWGNKYFSVVTFIDRNSASLGLKNFSFNGNWVDFEDGPR